MYQRRPYRILRDPLFIMYFGVILFLAFTNISNIYLNYVQTKYLTNTLEKLNGHTPSMKQYLEENGFRGVPVNFIYTGELNISLHTEARAFYKSGEIYVHEDKNSRYGLPFTLYHEYGHHVWAKILTKEQKEEYIKLYDSLGATTTYGLEGGVQEDFCDSLAAYYTGLLNLDVEKYIYFVNLRKSLP
jgi:hypothetical protein